MQTTRLFPCCSRSSWSRWMGPWNRRWLCQRREHWRVLALSPVPLLLLRPGGQYVSHVTSVLVPVDGSPGGALALGAAVGLAEASGASLRLLEVVVPIPTYLYGAYAYNSATFVDPA